MIQNLFQRLSLEFNKVSEEQSIATALESKILQSLLMSADGERDPLPILRENIQIKILQRNKTFCSPIPAIDTTY